MIPNGNAYENFPPFAGSGTRSAPAEAKYALGMVPADTFPAEWANYFFHGATAGITRLNTDVNSIKQELNTILADFGITNDATVYNQLLQAMRLNASFVSAASTTVTGPLLITGATVRVMFTAAIAGSDTTTALTITYNNQAIPVKVYKEGSLANFTAAKISWFDSNVVYRYLDAGTTLELLYDGVQFVIVNDPIVLKSNRYAIHADGNVEGGNIASIKPSFTETLDYGWLACEHQSLLRADYPKLLNYFQTHTIGSDTMLDVFGYADADHFYLPDTREVALVGAGQNDSDSIATHDVYTVGKFKDDQLQSHTHQVTIPGLGMSGANGSNRYADTYLFNQGTNGMFYCRYGDVTRGKRKGVKFIIKVL